MASKQRRALLLVWLLLSRHGPANAVRPNMAKQHERRPQAQKHNANGPFLEQKMTKNENETYIANNYTETNETASGIGSIINKAATGAGILSQYPELNHLVSIIR